MNQLPNIASMKQEKYNVLQAAAQRALYGWPVQDQDQQGKTPKKQKPFPDVVVPDAPQVGSRQSPGIVPPKAY